MRLLTALARSWSRLLTATAPLTVALLLGACDSPAGPSRPQVVSIAVGQARPLVGVLDVVLRSAAPLTVEYWADDGPRMRIRSPSATTHSITLARLRANRLYHYEAQETGHAGVVETGALPEDLAGLTFEASGAPTLDLVLVHRASAPSGSTLTRWPWVRATTSS